MKKVLDLFFSLIGGFVFLIIFFFILESVVFPVNAEGKFVCLLLTTIIYWGMSIYLWMAQGEEFGETIKGTRKECTIVVSVLTVVSIGFLYSTYQADDSFTKDLPIMRLLGWMVVTAITYTFVRQIYFYLTTRTSAQPFMPRGPRLKALNK